MTNNARRVGIENVHDRDGEKWERFTCCGNIWWTDWTGKTLAWNELEQRHGPLSPKQTVYED